MNALHSIIIILLIGIVSAGYKPECPANWLPRPGSEFCYRFYKDLKYGWKEAESMCAAYGGNLMSIKDLGEKIYLSEIASLADYSATDYLIGLSQDNPDGAWEWVDDGTKLDTTVINWVNGNPGSKKCAQYQTGKDHGGKAGLEDVDCGAQGNFICKRSINEPTYCDSDSGWFQVAQSCVGFPYGYLYAQSYTNAEYNCEYGGGHIVVLDTDSKVNYLIELLNKNYWDKTWLGLFNTENGDFEWIDNATGIAPNWAPNEPPQLDNSTAPMTYCAQLWVSDGLWHTDYCDTSYTYGLCQKPLENCPSGWNEINGNCFQFNNDYVSYLRFDDALAQCRAQNTSLMEIHNADTNNYIWYSLYDTFWFGITNNKSSGHDFTDYYWVSSWTSVWDGYTNFIDNKTNNDDHEHPFCGAFEIGYYQQPNWNTVDCSNTYMFGCSAPVGTKITPSGNLEGYVCDDGWDLLGSYCYLKSTNENTWVLAQQLCHDNDSSLASIFHGDEQSYLDNEFTVNYWTGLNRREDSDNFFWEEKGSSSGIPLGEKDYKDWDNGEPNDDKKKNCMFVSNVQDPDSQLWNGKWHMEDCSLSKTYACKKKARKQSDIPPTQGGYTLWPSACGPYWYEEPVSGYCYRASTETNTLIDAEDYCLQMGGHLASIHSSQEQSLLLAYVNKLLEGDFQVWIGATQKGNYEGWKWTDDSAFSYMNWDKGQPMLNWDQDCTLMTEQGAWRVGNCDERRVYLCEKQGAHAIATSTPFVPPPTNQPGQYYGCPHGSGWYEYGQYCYIIQGNDEAGSNFDDANTACRKIGTELASIEDFDENDFIISVLRFTDNSSLWIGLNDRRSSGTYEWIDGAPVTFTLWDYAMPDNFNHAPCVEIQREHGHWDTKTCDTQLPFICKTHKSIQSGTSVPPPPTGCPRNSVAYMSKCYFIYQNSEKAQADAQSDCNSFFGNLAIITNNYQQAFLTSVFGQYSGMYWIGLQSTDGGNTYTWVDGSSPSGFTNWDANYPDGRKGQCVYATTSTPPGLWRNGDCDSKQHFICEFPRDGYTEPHTTTTTINPAYKCPDTWNGNQDIGKCFKAFGEFETEYYSPRKYSDAESFCVTLGGHLASVTDVKTQDFLYGNNILAFFNNYWIGLNALDGQNWDSWGWTDGSGVDYVNWGDGQPAEDTHDAAQCVNINGPASGTWFNSACSKHLNWVCELSIGTTEMTTPMPINTSPSPHCNDRPDWFYYNGSCWYVTDAFYTSTWQGADKNCKGFPSNTYLASIHTIDQEIYLHDLIQQKGYSFSKYWIGYNKLNSDNNQFKWVDETQSDFDYWGPNEPSDEGYGETDACTSMSGDNGEWVSENCGNEHGYICRQWVDDPPYIPVPPVPVPGFCQDGWFKSDTKCYKIFPATYWPDYSDWKGALHACQSSIGIDAKYHPSLASIPDEKAMLTIMSHLKDLYYQTWIGLTDYDSGFKFVWADNAPITYTNWAPGEPNFLDQEYCTEMYYFKNLPGMWNDITCYNAQGYLCEMDPDPKLVTPTPDTTVCGSQGFTEWNGDSCYKLSVNQGTWEEIQAECQSYSTDTNLASINGPFEEAFVRSMTYDVVKTESLWIGLTDENKQGVYEWIDGWPVLYSHWGPGQPTAFDDQGCAVLTAASDGRWSDENCTMAHRGICKNTRETKPTAQPNNCPGQVCPPTRAGQQWVNGGGCFCYLAFTDQVDEAHAQQSCAQLEANLVSIHDQGEEDFLTNQIQSLVKDNYWIGLVTDTQTGGYQWTDGTAVDYTNWIYWNPGTGNCVFKHNGANYWDSQWESRDCDEQHNYVCKAHKSAPKQTTYAPPPACPNNPGWVQHGDFCYQFNYYYSSYHTWQGAEDKCYKENGAHLVSILSDSEMNFVGDVLKNDAQWQYDNFWIGLSADPTGQFSWVDGSIVDFVNWEDSQPNLDTSCVVLDFQSDPKYLWKTDNCGHGSNPYICKKPASGTVAPITTPLPPTGNCRDGFVTFDQADHCYGFFSQSTYQASWNLSRQACKQLGGDLASIHSDIEMAYLISTQAYNPNKVWIGFSDVSSDYSGYFLWSDETEVTFTNWAPDEPNFNWGQKNCAYLDSGANLGQWKIGDCSSALGYVCEIAKDPHMPPPPPPTLPASLNTTCPSGYTAYPPTSSCYMVTSTSSDFDSSVKMCHSSGGNLVSINGIQEEAIVRVMLAERFTSGHSAWIGLTKSANGDFGWVDGFPTYYTHWGYNEPVQTPHYDCVNIQSDGSWHAAACSSPLAAVCKYTPFLPPTIPTPYPGLCPVNSDPAHPWYDLGTDKCYQVVFDKTAGYNDAELGCKRKLATLVAFHSNDEIANLSPILKNHVQNFWIGLLKTESGDWRWDDGSALDFTNWKTGQPNPPSYADCVAAYMESSGKWDADYCYSGKGYICQAYKTPIPTNTATTGQSSVTQTFPVITPPNSGIIKPKTLPGWTSVGIAGIILTVLIAIMVGFVGYLFYVQWSRGDFATPAAGSTDKGFVSRITSMLPGIKPATPAGFENIAYSAETEETKIGDKKNAEES